MDNLRKTRAVTAALAMATVLVATAAKAEFLGGVAGVSHSLFVSETDMAKSSAGVRLEWGFGQRLSTQLDASYTGLHALDDNALNLTGHIGWDMGIGTAGLFYGWDKMASTRDFYGAEYAGRVAAADLEGYLARVDGEGTMFGLSARVPVNARLGLGGSLDYMNADGMADGTRIGVAGDYALGLATRLSGEIGHFSGDDNDGNSMNEAYVRLGVDFLFGAQGGTTFGSRSLFNFAPGL